ncbi:MAG TPA: M20 family metallo-hydrolase [Sphingomicrobium sp.]|nr:M20 family metallo-hydrolase [Sphingomicrobium sp.]
MTGVVASRVSQERLWDRHMIMAHFGATASGGVNRQALSPEDAAAQRQLIEWGMALGLSASADAAGNLFLRLAGTEAAPSVMTGSHMDSQPTGGKFDGIYGVLAGLEAVQALIEAGIRPRRPIEIVAWMNEEGSRFAPGMMGSEVFAGVKPLEEILAVRDQDGVSVAEALATTRTALPQLPERPIGAPIAAYLEAHIEQGPVLERHNKIIGVVSGIQGKRTFRVEVSGEDAHAGTTALRDRKDALLAATSMVQQLHAFCASAGEHVMFTVGRFTVEPNAPSVIASKVVFSIDLRHPEQPTLQRLGDSIATLCDSVRGPCATNVTELVNAPSLEFPIIVRDRIRHIANELGLPVLDIPSLAGHDARHLHYIALTGMIFVPCRSGISHNEAEWAEPVHLAQGAQVLAEVLAELAA